MESHANTDEAVAKGAALYGLEGIAWDEVRETPGPGPCPRTAPEKAARSISTPFLRGPEWTEASTVTWNNSSGFTLTGPVRELVNTRIVNVLSKSLGVVARDNLNKDVVVYLFAPQQRGADGVRPH